MTNAFHRVNACCTAPAPDSGEFLFQAYVRDIGIFYAAVSVPVHHRGCHWGLIFSLRHEALLAMAARPSVPGKAFTCQLRQHPCLRRAGRRWRDHTASMARADVASLAAPALSALAITCGQVSGGSSAQPNPHCASSSNSK